MERSLLLGDDAEREVHPGDECRERVAQDAGPLLADVAELPGQRGRGVAGGRAQQLDERLAVGPEPGSVGEGHLEPRDGIAVAGRAFEWPVVDQLAERPDGRILVGDPDEDELLEPRRPRFGTGGPPGELRREPIEQALRVAPAETLLECAQGDIDGVRRAVLLVPRDDQMADLVDQPHRPDLAGRDRRRAAPRRSFIRFASRRMASEVGRDEIAGRADQAAVDAVALARDPLDVEGTHRPKHRMAGGARRAQGQTGAASAGRVEATCSMARRSSSRPDGSNS